LIEHMPLKTKPRAIIYDWDNTLVDSWPPICDALNITLAAFDLPAWSMEEVRGRVRKSLRESFPDLFGDQWHTAADIFYERYGEIHATSIKPIKGISEMLAHNSELGIFQAIVSNKRGDYLRKEAEKLGWAHFFGPIIGANDAPNDKPAIDPVHMALCNSGFAAGQTVWFVGDTDIDMQCAINANCIPVLMRAGIEKEGEFDDFPPQLRFQTAEALCKHLRNL
jgi:phosphoglycolate phosphatase